MALERGHRGLLQVVILELEDLKVQSYSRFKIELLKSRKGDMRKFDLHGVSLLQKVCIASSYLEPN